MDIDDPTDLIGGGDDECEDVVIEEPVKNLLPMTRIPFVQNNLNSIQQKTDNNDMEFDPVMALKLQKDSQQVNSKSKSHCSASGVSVKKKRIKDDIILDIIEFEQEHRPEEFQKDPELRDVIRKRLKTNIKVALLEDYLTMIMNDPSKIVLELSGSNYQNHIVSPLPTNIEHATTPYVVPKKEEPVQQKPEQINEQQQQNEIQPEQQETLPDPNSETFKTNVIGLMNAFYVGDMGVEGCLKVFSEDELNGFSEESKKVIFANYPLYEAFYKDHHDDIVVKIVSSPVSQILMQHGSVAAAVFVENQKKKQ